MENKHNLIYEYSNPDIVMKKAREIFGDDIELKISTHKNKKYMIKGAFTNDKWIHFGQMFYEDYTKHQNHRRLINFRNRNHKWMYSKPNTSSFLSFYLLW